jgi:hypothetical protein
VKIRINDNAHFFLCVFLLARRHTIPIIALALTTGGSPYVRKPPPLYIPVGSPKRPQPPGPRGVGPTPALRTRRFSKPAATSGAPRSCANSSPTERSQQADSFCAERPAGLFECVRGRLAGTKKRHPPPHI